MSALVEVFDAEILGVLGERLDLEYGFLLLRDALGAIGGGDVVVDDGERLSGARTLRPVMRSPSKPAGW